MKGLQLCEEAPRRYFWYAGQQSGRLEGFRLPEISRFFGIIIAMFYSDHPPPHFHVRYGRERAMIEIESLSLLGGRLAPRALGLVIEWAAQHQDELRANWELARRHAPLHPIAPLE